jgi:hypothetical protein
VASLVVGFGLTLTDTQTGAIIALATILLGSFQRTQTAPLEKPSFTNTSNAPTLP